MINEEVHDVHRYDDIINLSHHVSKFHPPMSRLNRAAQFSPFAALTGYEGAIEETSRLTDRKVELDEATKAVLDEKLRIIQEQLTRNLEIEITYFQPDEKKDGGAYVSTFGIVKKIDNYERAIVMEDGTRIGIEDIISIKGEAIQSVDDYYI